MQLATLRLLSSAILILGISSFVFAQLDPTFGTAGVVINNTNLLDRPIGTFLMPDQKILVVNESFETIHRYHLIRFNADGTPDATFGTNGKVPITGILLNTLQAGSFTRAVQAPDGKILLLGTEQAAGLVARIDSSGAVDTSFSDDGIHRPNIEPSETDLVTDAAFQPDGKIVVTGYLNATARIFLIRYNANGTLDGSFGSGGFIVHNVSLSRARRVLLQSTGKIIVSSGTAAVTQELNLRVARFNSDGSLDATFPQITTQGLRATVLQPDDKIVTASAVQANDPLEQSHSDILLSRYNADGTPDGSFGTAGSTQLDLTSSRCDDLPNGLAVLSDGQILVSAVTNVQANRRTILRGPMLALTRFSSTGTPNGKFLQVDGHPADDALLALYPDGRVISSYRTRPVGVGNPETNLIVARSTGVPVQNYRFKGVPFDFAKPLADGFADPSLFRPSDRKWWYFPDGISYSFGLVGDIFVASDYIKDTGTERAVFRPSEGRWYIGRTHNNPNDYFVIQWGLAGDVPVPADYDGDLKSDVAVFRPSDGVWYIRRSSDSSPQFIRWGTNGDKPAPGDFDGDGLEDAAVFRPSNGDWYILRSSDGQPVYIHFGLNGDIPVQEDYDGDGKTDIAVWRPSTGVWYRLNSSDGSFFAFGWGLPTDVATPADYDGDTKPDVAVWRASEGRWYVFGSATNSMLVYNWGVSTDLPISARN